MAKYVTFFTYTSDAWARMIQSPGDRTATIRQVADSLGGSVECVYWVFGTHDGMVITDFPDSISAAGMSVTAGSSGAFKTLETHELRRLTSHRASKASVVGARREFRLPDFRVHTSPLQTPEQVRRRVRAPWRPRSSPVYIAVVSTTLAIGLFVRKPTSKRRAHPAEASGRSGSAVRARASLAGRGWA
jgi:uncharacterized protein with GYD domain